MGEVVLGRKVGNNILWGAIAGTIPDLDVLARSLFDPLRANELHRGITHSILFSAAMAPVLAIWLKRHAASLPGVHPARCAHLRAGAENAVVRGILLVVTAAIIALIFRRKRLADSGTRTEERFLVLVEPRHPPLARLPHHLGHTALLGRSRGSSAGTTSSWWTPLHRALHDLRGHCHVHPPRQCPPPLGELVGHRHQLVVHALHHRLQAHRRGCHRTLDRQHIPYVDFTTRPTPFNSILWSVNVDAGDHYLLGYHSLLDTKPGGGILPAWTKVYRTHPWADDKVRRLQVLTDHDFVVRSRSDTIVFNDSAWTDGRTFAGQALRVRYMLIPTNGDLRVEFKYCPASTAWRGPRNAVE